MGIVRRRMEPLLRETTRPGMSMAMTSPLFLSRSLTLPKTGERR